MDIIFQYSKKKANFDRHAHYLSFKSSSRGVESEELIDPGAKRFYNPNAMADAAAEVNFILHTCPLGADFIVGESARTDYEQDGYFACVPEFGYTRYIIC